MPFFPQTEGRFSPVGHCGVWLPAVASEAESPTPVDRLPRHWSTDVGEVGFGGARDEGGK